MITVINKAKIKTLPMLIGTSDPASAKIAVNSLSFFPYILISKFNDQKEKIKGATVDPKDTIYIKLHNSRFLPEIELFCEDSKAILFNDLYPFDQDTVISIFVKSNTNKITEKNQKGSPIRMDFKVTEYETVKVDVGDGFIFKYLIKGILDVEELHYTRWLSIKDKSSYDALKGIASEMNLGFASNVQESNDKMTWLSAGDSYLEFIKEISSQSFISEDSFVWTFIDFQYNLNYINIQSELNEFTKEEAYISSEYLDNDPEEKPTITYLTNNKAADSTNKYISSFNIVNQSFKVNLEKFYRLQATWYDKDVNTIFKPCLKELETNDVKLGKNEGKLKQLVNKNSKIYDENNDDHFVGKIDTDNVHKNFALAKKLNKFNLDNLEKMKMIVILNMVNFSIKRFETVLVEIYNINDIFSEKAGPPEAGGTIKKDNAALYNINTTLSGYWYVTGINYLYKRNNGVEQEITLMRRDLSIDYGME